MKDYEIFCVLVAAMKRIGNIETLTLNKYGDIMVSGTLPDGRMVSLSVMPPMEGKFDV